MRYRLVVFGLLLAFLVATPCQAQVLAGPTPTRVPVNEQFMQELVADTEAAMQGTKGRYPDVHGPLPVTHFAHRWALIKRFAPDDFKRHFREEYWQAMKRALAQEQELKNLARDVSVMRHLFPDRAGEVHLSRVVLTLLLQNAREETAKIKDVDDALWALDSLQLVFDLFPDQRTVLHAEIEQCRRAVASQEFQAWVSGRRRWDAEDQHMYAGLGFVPVRMLGIFLIEIKLCKTVGECDRSVFVTGRPALVDELRKLAASQRTEEYDMALLAADALWWVDNELPKIRTTR